MSKQSEFCIAFSRSQANLQKGNILISVHADSSDEIERAREIFAQAGAEDIRTVVDSSAPDPSNGQRSTDCRTPDQAWSSEEATRRDVMAPR